MSPTGSLRGAALLMDEKNAPTGGVAAPLPPLPPPPLPPPPPPLPPPLPPLPRRPLPGRRGVAASSGASPSNGDGVGPKRPPEDDADLGSDDAAYSDYSGYSDYDSKLLAYEERQLDYDETMLEREERQGRSAAPPAVPPG